MAMWYEATAPSCYGHTFALAFQPLYIYVCRVPWCNSNPMTASGAPEVPTVAGNTQADDTLPSIGARGKGRTTHGPHTKLFGGARQSPPPPARQKHPDAPPIAPTKTPSPSPPPPPPGGLRPTVSLGGGVVGVQNRGVGSPVVCQNFANKIQDTQCKNWYAVNH